VNLTALAVAVLALLATLGLRLPAAINGLLALRRARAAGRYTEPIRKDMADAAVRTELLRSVKCGIIVLAVWLSFTAIDYTVEIRNAALALIALLLGVNSLLDEIVERRWLRTHKK
jgi:hypothetical protein